MRSDSTNYGVKQYAFNTFCFKAFAAERLPDSVKAKGFNQRCVEIPCFYGIPAYDITEIVNPAGVEDYQNLLHELIETRNTLLLYRLMHYHDPIPTVKLNIDGRENQLFSPLIRIFQGTKVLAELLPVISKYVSERRERTANSWHAHLYRVVRDLIKSQDRTELEFSLIWDMVTGGLAGAFKTESHQTYESEEFGSISRKGLSEQLQQIFGARQSQNRREARKLVFDKSKLDRLAQQYDLDVKVHVVTGVTDVTDSVRRVGIEKFQYITTTSDTGEANTAIPAVENLSHLSQLSQNADLDNSEREKVGKSRDRYEPGKTHLSPKDTLVSYGVARVSLFLEIAVDLEKSTEGKTIQHEELDKQLVASGKIDAGEATAMISDAVKHGILEKIDWHVYKLAKSGSLK